MQSILAYIRSLIGGVDDLPAVRTSVKRDRTDDGFALEDESPSLKRIKQLKRSNFPDITESNDGWDIKEKPNKVRYVPIQVEAFHPSTSTPNEASSKGCRLRTVPVEFVEMNENRSSTPCRKPRMHTPVHPIIHAVIDDEDEEVTLVENKAANSKKKIYVDLGDEESDERENEVIFVKKVVTAPTPIKPYKYFYTTNNHDVVDLRDDNSEKYYRISRRLDDRNTTNTSPKTYSKFRAPAGVSKTYKKAPTPVPKWWQTQKGTSLSNFSNKYLNINGNTRTTLSEIFNLDEKRNYQELIRKVTGQVKPISFRKPVEIVNLADDAASLRMTQRAQKRALNEIKQIEKDMSTEKENEETKEYDPVTVASINSSDSDIEIVPSESSTSSLKIDPVNSLKDSYKDRPVTADNWLVKLDTKYRKKRQETQEKLKDARRESDIISKINYEQKLALLEHKIKHDLCIPECLIEEIPPVAEFPELTLEQEKLVKKSLGPGPPGQVLAEKFNLRITRRDLQTLSGSNWLNDEVINFYMNLLMERSQQTSSLPRVYATNTFFYPKLMQGGQAGLRRWTRKVDIFSHDLMVVPVHLGVHWCLSLVDFRRRRVAYLDSMGGRNQPCLDALLQYLRDEHRDKKGQPFDDSGWKMECLSKDIPQQMNGSDCGMFACTFAEFSCRDAPYSFTQTHMPYLRRKAALEILTGKLLL